MRQIFSISLSKEDAKFINQQVRKRGFPSRSHFIRHLLGLDKDLISEDDVLMYSRKAEVAHKAGKTKKLGSLCDLMD